MAQFRATIKGQRGESSRLGSKSTGLVANVNGWDAGIEIEADHQGGQDRFLVFITGGSNGLVPRRLVGVLLDAEIGPLWNPQEA